MNTIRCLRILEYIGTQNWIEKTMDNSYVPFNGERTINNGNIIRSYLIDMTAMPPTVPQAETESKPPEHTKMALSIKFEGVLYNFNFKAVESVMNALNWTWCSSPKSPTIEEMKTLCRKLFYGALNDFLKTNDFVINSSGGFRVTIYKDADRENEPQITLEFITTEETSW